MTGGASEVERAEAAIRRLLADRAPGATICPSEAARAVDPAGWRTLMTPVREAARRLVVSGDVVLTQSGRVVDPDDVRGPVRIRSAG